MSFDLKSRNSRFFFGSAFFAFCHPGKFSVVNAHGKRICPYQAVPIPDLSHPLLQTKNTKRAAQEIRPVIVRMKTNQVGPSMPSTVFYAMYPEAIERFHRMERVCEGKIRSTHPGGAGEASAGTKQ
jgi:hypothetical protein